MKMVLYSRADKTRFQQGFSVKKGFAHSPVLKVGNFETQKWPSEFTCKIESSSFLSVVLAKNRPEKLLASRKLRTTRQKMEH